VKNVIVTTTPEIPGHKIKRVLGIVNGTTVRTRGAWGRFLAGLKATFGGKVGAVLKEVNKAQDEAIQNLIKNAQEMGANAVIGVRLEITEIFEGMVLINASGTAVEIEPE